MSAGIEKPLRRVSQVIEIPPRRMMSSYFAISAWMKVRNASGVLPIGSFPSSAKRVRMAGVASTAATAACISRIMGTGVPVTCSPEMAPFFGRVRSSEGRTNEAQQVQR